MQLLIQRGQTEGQAMVGKPIFSLWAKFELTADELALIDRYKVRKTVLFPGNPNDIRKAARYAALVSLVAYVVLAFEAPSPLALFNLIPLALIIFVIAIPVIYQSIRQKITVSDIITGRQFRCPDVLDLVDKEEFITDVAGKFRFFLEKMETWGGREVVEITPYEPPTPRLIEPPHAA